VARTSPHVVLRGFHWQPVALARQYGSLDGARSPRAVAAFRTLAFRAPCLHGGPPHSARGYTALGLLPSPSALAITHSLPFVARASGRASCTRRHGVAVAGERLAPPALITHTHGYSGPPASSPAAGDLPGGQQNVRNKPSALFFRAPSSAPSPDHKIQQPQTTAQPLPSHSVFPA